MNRRHLSSQGPPFQVLILPPLLSLRLQNRFWHSKTLQRAQSGTTHIFTNALSWNNSVLSFLHRFACKLEGDFSGLLCLWHGSQHSAGGRGTQWGSWNESSEFLSHLLKVLTFCNNHYHMATHTGKLPLSKLLSEMTEIRITNKLG